MPMIVDDKIFACLFLQIDIEQMEFKLHICYKLRFKVKPMYLSPQIKTALKPCHDPQKIKCKLKVSNINI